MTIAMRVEEVKREGNEMRLVVEVPYAYQAEALQVFEVGSVFGAAVLEGNNGANAMEAAGPYHSQALIWTTMFFSKSEVAEKLGTDSEYIAWCKTLPCCITDRRDYNDGVEGIDYAHVRRAGAAGTGYKPPFSGVPLIHRAHAMQHQKGEFAVLQHFYRYPEDEEWAKRWFDKKAAHYLSIWAKRRFLALQQQNYLSNIPPATIVQWAKDNSLVEHIPTEFKELI